MYEVTINYKTFVFTTEQLQELNLLIQSAKIKARGGKIESHTLKFEAYTTVRWEGDSE